MSKRSKSASSVFIPTGVKELDALAHKKDCGIQDYISAVSAYVREQGALSVGAKKAAQIRLSNVLGRALVTHLSKHLDSAHRAYVGERKVAGGLRTTNVDVSEFHDLDGLRLAVELKPVNLAVGRAIWNRFGDLRTFAVNIHLKFPFAVLGGVLVIPSSEEQGSSAAQRAAAAEEVVSDTEAAAAAIDEFASLDKRLDGDDGITTRKSTLHLIDRAVKRIVRAGGRRTEADAAHLLESIAVVVYDPMTGQLHPTVPALESGLRWDEFIEQLARAYVSRFED